MKTMEPYYASDVTAAENTTDTFNLENFKKDLESSIASNFGSGGQYCHSISAPPAASSAIKNGLRVDSVGQINLPLSHGDVPRLVSRAKPLGLEVWEFASQQIAFAKNPAWQALRDQLMQKVWMNLSPYEERPTFKLDKLLLYGPGSRVESYAKPQSNDRIFATFQILLPSRFTGGQVEITFGTATTHYDIDQASETTVTAIAWYSDAVYQTKPIVSGYRLALSYQIIHTFPTPIPHLSFMLDNLAKLRLLLDHWSSEENSHSMPHILAFILKSNYRYDESGVGILTRNDGLKLQPVADLLGFKLLIAVLDCHLSGDADDHNGYLLAGSGPKRWSRPYPDGHRLPTMAVLRSMRLKANNFVDLDGNSYGHMTDWSLNESDIVLQAPLQEFVPDAVECGGFVHHGPRSLQFWFQRTILCILPGRTYLKYLVRELPHRISLWERKFEPSDAKDAILIVNSSTWPYLAPFVSRLRTVAIRWSNLALWGHILDAAISALGVDRRALETVAFFGACEAFSFGSTVARLEQSLEKQGLSRLILVASIPEYDDVYISSTAPTEWRIRYTQHIIRSLTELGAEDVTVLVEVAKQGDLCFVRDIMIPELALKQPAHDFCVEFTKALSAQRSLILPAQKSIPIIFAKEGSGALGSAGDQSAIFGEILDKCLDLAILPLQDTVHLDDHTQVSRVRVVQIVELCITTGRLEPCRGCLQYLLSFPWESDSAATQRRVATFFIPVIQDLRHLLQQYTIPVSSGPFATFFGVLIIRYTEFILGPKPLEDVTIGCGCPKCVQLVQFLTSADHHEMHVLAAKSVLDHMEGRLKMVPERATTRITEIPGRHKLEICKKPSTSQRGWNNRKGDAIKFLRLIGDRSRILEIFGNEPYEAVRMLLKSGTEERPGQVTIDLGGRGA